MNSCDAHVLDQLDAVPEKLECNSSLFDDRAIGRSGLTTAILRGSRGSGFRSTTIHLPTDSNRASGSAWITFLYWLGLARVANATPFFSTSV